MNTSATNRGWYYDGASPMADERMPAARGVDHNTEWFDFISTGTIDPLIPSRSPRMSAMCGRLRTTPAFALITPCADTFKGRRRMAPGKVA